MSVIQNKTSIAITDSWLVDGAPKSFPGATVVMEVTDPNGTRLPDVSAFWTSGDNNAATGTFQVTISTLITAINDVGKPVYTVTRQPYKLQFRVNLPDTSHQYMNEFGVHVAPNLDD